jgi:hypothetical protein
VSPRYRLVRLSRLLRIPRRQTSTLPGASPLALGAGEPAEITIKHARVKASRCRLEERMFRQNQAKLPINPRQFSARRQSPLNQHILPLSVVQAVSKCIPATFLAEIDFA